ncbi:type II toxin-antitoxin system RelE/ParE family toxin [Flavobacterium sp. NST-5]|uniref:Type II toxin-antitoxin system RelE/ParE family toxin n=1 Tax=Flavobacterium ichthyis TaxID=2698827 RepID=A0ABW9Z7X1_9FLAO|nr:type II toxin-antitoxin system RelE/ParE family toxin [Flavobacterium ichthyis]NBL63934.1 type II toxin-antitoxin system RelE/ParE family toxin [Flavobacterium ichthyis]
MVFKIIISKLASLEITETIDFYESRQKGLGKQFLNSLKLGLTIIKSNPELFSIKRKSTYREMKFKKFPFIVIYEIIGNEVIVYSVFHTSRNPEKKP